MPQYSSAGGRPWTRGLMAGALALTASAWITRRMTRRVQARTPPHGKFVLAQGVRLHYTEYGKAGRPTVVLVHGNGAMAREMEISGLPELLARDFHVLVFDRPGYGYSERPYGRIYTPHGQAEILLAAMKTLSIERPIVLGHSWGAMVALAMGLREPLSVRALVLVSGYYTPTLRLDGALLGAPAIPLVGTVLRHTVGPWLARLIWPLMIRRVFAPSGVTERFDREYPVWMSLRPGPLRASASEAVMMQAQALRLMRRQNELEVPAMIVAGDKDRLVMTNWQSQRLHDRVPRSRLQLVAGAGHMVHHTAPAQVAQAVYEAWHMSAPATPEAAPEPRPAASAAAP
jgi:pimeloyl-ACP methyl ester carboxylesterase